MVKENQVVVHKECVGSYSHICWSAIFAGAFVGVGLGFLLHLFSIAIGLSAYSSSPSGATMVAIGGVLGLLIGVIVAMGAAGFVAGYLGRFHHCYCHGGVIYGFATWSVALVLSAALVSPLTNYVSFYKNSLTSSVVIAHSAANEASSPIIEVDKKETNKKDTVSSTELAWLGWIIFGLFFIGALASCIGACWGMCCKRRESPSEFPSSDIH